MADISKFIGDKTAQEDGTWIKFEAGIEFLLVYSEKGKPNQFFMNGYTRLRQKRRGKIPKSVDQEKLAVDMLVEHVVKGWKGLEQKDPSDAEGKRMIEFPYNKENCRKLLEDSPVIKLFVIQQAQDGDNFGMTLDDDFGEDEAEGTAHGDLKSSAAVES